MKIVIDPFDPKSISEALKVVKRYKKEFEAKEREFVRRIAELGVSVASSGFATADYDGVNDVQVTMTHSGDKAVVTAFGETVGFIEFGTGVKYPEWDASGMEYTPPKHGTYGKGRGKNPHGWFFKQGEAVRHTYGNQPAEAMRTARDTMVERVIQIAREVWK
jgi:hypothetical protein